MDVLFSTVDELIADPKHRVSQRPPTIRFVGSDVSSHDLPVLKLRELGLRYATMLVAEHGVRKGEVVPLFFSSPDEFLVAFFGVLLAGGLPTALPAPGAFGGMADSVRRIRAACSFFRNRHIITSRRLREWVAEAVPAVIPIVDPELPARPDVAILPARSSSDPAILQYTSGSTGSPKGVVLSHANVLANVHQIGEALRLNPDDVGVFWLPLSHDMGLIGGLLTSLYWGIDLVLMSPSTFLRRPSAWLRAISEHRGTISSAPNFAYAYTVDRVKDAELEGLDLSSLRVAITGAERITRRALDAFHARFSASGLRRDVFLPSYGLAEASLAVTLSPLSTPLRTDIVDHDKLVDRGEVVVLPAETETVRTMTVVSCGAPLPGTRVRIVDADGIDLPPCRIGRILVSGPSIMKHYEGAPDAVLRDGWLSTGDTAYHREGQIYVIGRVNEAIILRGRNYPPNEFEWAAAEAAGVRQWQVAAFGVYDEKLGTERLVIVCETELRDEAERGDLCRRISAHVAERVGVWPDSIRLTTRGRLPRTTSGKVQRTKVKVGYVPQPTALERPS